MLSNNSNAVNDFAFNIMKNIDGPQNQIVSPISIQLVLAMILLGASKGSKTEKELKEVLAVQDRKGERGLKFHEDTSKLIEEISKSSKDFKLIISNFILSNKNHVTLKDEYKKLVKRNYKAGLKEFNREEIDTLTERTNRLISEKTNGFIKDIVTKDTFSADTSLVLLNAAYFKSAWKYRFHYTRKDVFYNQGKKYDTDRVDFMISRDDHYFVDFSPLNCLAVKIQLLAEDFSVIFILPKRRDGLQELVSAIDSESLNEMLEKMKQREVDIALPEFTIEDSPKMMEVLKELGLDTVFREAHLDNMTDSSQGLKIDNVVHKAKIIVNEDGVEAAASTLVKIVPLSLRMSIPFKADHPFMFIVRNDKSGLPLFIGRVNQL